MEVSLLDAMSDRTGFLADSCRECGYIRNYKITMPRPIWHWVLLGVGVVLLIVLSIVLIAVLLWWKGMLW